MRGADRSRPGGYGRLCCHGYHPHHASGVEETTDTEERVLCACLRDTVDYLQGSIGEPESCEGGQLDCVK